MPADALLFLNVLSPHGDLPSENAPISKQRTRVSKTVTGR